MGRIQEGGWDIISHLHVPCHPRDTLSLQKVWKEPVMAMPSGHTCPSLRDLDNQHWMLRAPAPQISVSAALFQDSEGCTRCIPAPPNPALQIAPTGLFSPRMVGGKRRHPRPGFGK